MFDHEKPVVVKNVALFLLLASFPLSAAAGSPTAGTDEYLRSIGYTDEQLKARVATEERDPFSMADGTIRVEDPVGDVLERWGTTSAMHEGWGDVEQAVVSKNETTQTWDVAVTMAEEIPKSTPYKAQFFLMMDTDGEKANNDREGIRIGTDAEFSVQYNQDHGWYADFRWYNADADFWAANKETGSAFDINGRTLTLRVPFAEAPATLAPHWRVVAGIADPGGVSQIDVAPGTGFPPPKGQASPSADASRAFSSVSLAGTAAVGILAGLWVAKKRRK